MDYIFFLRGFHWNVTSAFIHVTSKCTEGHWQVPHDPLLKSSAYTENPFLLGAVDGLYVGSLIAPWRTPDV